MCSNISGCIRYIDVEFMITFFHNYNCSTCTTKEYQYIYTMNRSGGKIFMGKGVWFKPPPTQTLNSHDKITKIGLRQTKLSLGPFWKNWPGSGHVYTTVQTHLIIHYKFMVADHVICTDRLESACETNTSTISIKQSLNKCAYTQYLVNFVENKYHFTWAFECYIWGEVKKFQCGRSWWL